MHPADAPFAPLRPRLALSFDAPTTAAQLAALRDAQAATGRIFSVWFSERFESRATMRASRLVADGAPTADLVDLPLDPVFRRLATEAGSVARRRATRRITA